MFQTASDTAAPDVTTQPITGINAAWLLANLRAGESYAGIVMSADGQLGHHLFLLPGDVAGKNWSEATEWAHAAGGDLPSRSEQALLFANTKGEFKADWYWSGEQHAAYACYAWYQVFDDGGQSNYHQVGQPPRSRSPQIDYSVIHQFRPSIRRNALRSNA